MYNLGVWPMLIILSYIFVIALSISVREDDGNWFISEIGHSFHIGWSDSYIDALQTLKNHVQKKCLECQNQENQ